MNWIQPKVVIGNKAIGDYYFHRPTIVSDIWSALKKGSHVLLAAPRRVGKTSVMIFMTENCEEDIKCIFENIQGIKSENEFYKRVYELILSCLQKDKKIWSKIGNYLKSIRIDELNLKGAIKIGRNELDFLDEIDHIVPKLKDVKVILFLDELPEVLHKLHKNDKTEEASGIIKNMRRWRQEKEFGNLSFVLAGSIGIHHVVKTIEGRTSDLNDQYKINFEALTDAEASEYVSWATKEATIQYDEKLKPYLLHKISHYIPYFINLMLDQIHNTAQKQNNPTITTAEIDKAFDEVVKNSDHFKDWRNRLFDYYPKKVAGFLDRILTHIAHNESITKQQVYDIALKLKQQNECIDLMEELGRDGYVQEKDNTYSFISPFLKAYWKRYLPK